MHFFHLLLFRTGVDRICVRANNDDLFMIVDFGQVWTECLGTNSSICVNVLVYFKILILYA